MKELQFDEDDIKQSNSKLEICLLIEQMHNINYPINSIAYNLLKNKHSSKETIKKKLIKEYGDTFDVGALDNKIKMFLEKELNIKTSREKRSTGSKKNRKKPIKRKRLPLKSTKKKRVRKEVDRRKRNKVSTKLNNNQK